VKRTAPDRGDILHLNLDPAFGKEQHGQRYVLVLTSADFNRPIETPTFGCKKHNPTCLFRIFFLFICGI